MADWKELAELRDRERAKAEAMRSQLKNTGCKVAYLPMPMPVAKVDYILIAMEPSLRLWAGNDDESVEAVAEQKVEDGFKAFTYSWEDFCFLYSIEEPLKASYYVTDASKAAMPVKYADQYRTWAYGEFLGLLNEEIELVGKPECRLFFVSKTVHDYFAEKKLRRQPYRQHLVHYTRRLTWQRRAIANQDGNRDEFRSFLRTHEEALRYETIAEFAKDFMVKHAVGTLTRAETMQRLESKHGELSLWLKELIFVYRHQIKESLTDTG